MQKEKKNLIIIHGLAQKKKQFNKIIASLEDSYNVFYFDYSCQKSLESQINYLLDFIIKNKIEEADFITSSFGAIIFRIFYSRRNCVVGGVVEVGPVNQGSKILEKVFKFKFIGNLFLGKIVFDFLLNKDKILELELPKNIGVIAGNKRFSFLFPELYITNLITNAKNSDGKVFVNETKFNGMSDFLLVNECHNNLLFNKIVIEKTKDFLETGHF